MIVNKGFRASHSIHSIEMTVILGFQQLWSDAESNRNVINICTSFVSGPFFASAGPLAPAGLRAPHPIPSSLPFLLWYLLPSPTFPLLPSHPLPSPPLPFEVYPLKSSLGERCKLPQWGLGQNPSQNRIWCILALKSNISWQQF